MIRALAILVAVLFACSRLHAWGGEGHQVVALIAEDRLTDAAKKQIHELLGNDADISDAEVANWADELRRTRRETAPWHYVNIPLDAKGFDEKRDGHDGKNVIDKVAEFEKILEDDTKPKADREEALKFLVHLIGDLHQPLHCSNRDDKGGNGYPVHFLKRKTATDLHAVWDTDLLRQYVGKTRIADYAGELSKSITKEQARGWSAGEPVDWANETFGVAVKDVYPDFPKDAEDPKVDADDVKAKRPIIEKQLMRAGVRLATVLNRSLGAHKTPTTRPSP